MKPIYTLSGTVVFGKQEGRLLGFPTANLSYPAGESAPADGVYAAHVWLSGEAEPRKAMLNQGAHPTLPKGRRSVEVHLFDYDGDLYGREMTVEYCAYLRPERRFSSVDELVEQLKQDKERALAWFADSK